jgi:hypothetical protein
MYNMYIRANQDYLHQVNSVYILIYTLFTSFNYINASSVWKQSRELI